MPKSSRGQVSNIVMEAPRPLAFRSIGNGWRDAGLHHAPARAPERSIESKLKEFEECESMWKVEAQNEEILFLMNREQVYSPDPYYIEHKQKYFTWYMRAVLVEWMMHVMTEYHLKRDVTIL